MVVLLDASAHLWSALNGNRSTTQQNESPQHSVRQSEQIDFPQSAHAAREYRRTEKLPRSPVPVFDLAIRLLHNLTPQMRGHNRGSLDKGRGPKEENA